MMQERCGKVETRLEDNAGLERIISVEKDDR